MGRDPNPLPIFSYKNQSFEHRNKKTLDISRFIRYNKRVANMRAISSVGQSHRLITGRSKVRALDGPPKRKRDTQRVSLLRFDRSFQREPSRMAYHSPRFAQLRRRKSDVRRKYGFRALDGPPKYKRDAPRVSLLCFDRSFQREPSRMALPFATICATPQKKI